MLTPKAATALVLSTLTVLGISSSFGKTIYVDKDGRCGGMSWENACTSLNTALDMAEPGDEILVAQGVYTPAPPGGPREASFQLKSGVRVKGGYAGIGASDPNTRDVHAYETILSGDLNGDDGPAFTNRLDNCYHVVSSLSTDDRVLLDGFTISGGHADGHFAYPAMKGGGGGVYVHTSQPTISRCTFSMNYATRGGALGVTYRGPARVIACTFVNNEAGTHGGAVYTDSAAPTFSKCLFVDNTAAQDGGAIALYAHHSSGWMMDGCRFYANQAKNGGAIHNANIETLTCTNCIFDLNSASETGGAICNTRSDLNIENCTFTRNRAEDSCGAINSVNRGLSLTNSIVWDNHDPNGTQIQFIQGSGYVSGVNEHLIKDLLIAYCNIQKSEQAISAIPPSALKWGKGNISDNPLFDRVASDSTDYTDPRISANSPCVGAGDPTAVIAEQTDVDGEPRIIDDRIDIGADEFSAEPVHVDNIVIIGPNQVHEESEIKLYTMATYSNGQTLDLSGSVVWSVKPQTYAAFASSGLLLAKGMDTHREIEIQSILFTRTTELGERRAIQYAPHWQTYYVWKMGGSDEYNGLTEDTAFATIQKAIDTAENGDMIRVCPGKYHEQIDFLGKGITVRGHHGAPVIDGLGYFAVTFENGEEHSSVLQNMIITNSFMGIFISGSSPTLDHLTVVDNNYAVGAYGPSEPDITNCILWDNTDGDLVGCGARFSCIERDLSGLLNIHANPLFAGPEIGDYRLASEAGRWDSGQNQWVLDTNTSPCVDTGDPYADPGQEIRPHGKRTNMGAYGGTPEASLSPFELEARRVDFEDYWPFALGSRWDDIPYSTTSTQWEVLDHLAVNGFDVWAMEYRSYGCFHGYVLIMYYVYVDGVLYRVERLPDLDSLPQLSAHSQIEYAQSVLLNRPTYIRGNQEVLPVQGTLAEVLALTSCPPDDSWCHYKEYSSLDFLWGNHDDVLAFLSVTERGTWPTAIFGKGVGPMLLGDVIYEGEVGPFVVTITEPEDNQRYTDPNSIQIQAQLDPINALPTAVRFLASGQPIGDDKDGEDGWSHMWTHPNHGETVLTAFALNHNQVVGASKAVTITVDHQYIAPIVSIAEPNEGQRYEPNTPIEISVEITSPVETIRRVDFYVDRELIGLDDDASNGWTFLWEKPVLGNHLLRAEAVTGYDNRTEESLSVWFIVGELDPQRPPDHSRG